jgi:AcrR family transcriptional regulator
MGRTREFDLDKALKTAYYLFWRKGYDGTSISDLTRAMGISAPSFYFAFGSKDALFQRIVDQYQAAFAQVFEQALSCADINEMIRQVLYGVADFVTHEAYPPGCLVLNSSLPVIDDHPFRKVFAEQRQALRLLLQQRFRQVLGAADSVRTDCDAETLAHWLVVQLWGLAVEAQSGASRADLYRIIGLSLPMLSRTVEPSERV